MVTRTIVALAAGLCVQLAAAERPLFGGSSAYAGNPGHRQARSAAGDTDAIATPPGFTSVHAWLDSEEHWRTFVSDKPVVDKAVWWWQRDTTTPVTISYVQITGPGTKGAVFVSVGNTEPLEKHAEAIWGLREQGYSPVFAIDHRGQGRSSRLLDDAYKSHVDDRHDYVVDFRQFVNLGVAQLAKDTKKFIFCHSMGCAVTFMYLIDEHRQGIPQQFNGLAANAPLVQPNTDPFSFGVANAIAQAQVWAGLGESYPPTLGGTLEEHYKEGAFATSSTTSHARYTRMKDLCFARQHHTYAAGHTGLCVGSATANTALEFVNLAKDFAAFQELATDLAVPVLVQQAALDRTVVNEPMTSFCSDAFRDCTLTVYPTSQHNIWWEADAIRTPALAEVYAFFDQQDVVQPHPVTTTTTQAPKKQCKWWQLSC